MLIGNRSVTWLDMKKDMNLRKAESFSSKDREGVIYMLLDYLLSNWQEAPCKSKEDHLRLSNTEQLLTCILLPYSLYTKKLKWQL